MTRQDVRVTMASSPNKIVMIMKIKSKLKCRASALGVLAVLSFMTGCTSFSEKPSSGLCKQSNCVETFPFDVDSINLARCEQSDMGVMFDSSTFVRMAADDPEYVVDGFRLQSFERKLLKQSELTKEKYIKCDGLSAPQEDGAK